MAVPARPAAVVFDCDGLLLDTESAWSRAEEVLYARHGVRFTLAHKRELLGTAGDQAAAIVARHVGRPEAGAALLAELAQLVLVEIARGADTQPGACELLAALRRQGVPLGLASNSPCEIVELALSVAGLERTFDSVLSGHELAHPKPAPDVYAESCRRLGADPRDCVALEDSATGVASARAAGMFVVGVPSLPGVMLDEAHLVAPSLSAREVWAAVGLALAA